MASNYKFMKSGFNMLEQEPLSEEMIENLYALVYAFMEKAIVSAEKYVNHAGRKIITKQDIKLGLKSETFQFLQRENFMEDIKRWREIMTEEEDPDEDLIEFESIVNHTDYVDFKKSGCSCNNCTFFNGIEEKWTAWEPHNQIELILKNAVLKIN